MSDEKKPDPIEDVRKGLGLLFRAAKNAVSELPTGKVEEAVATGLREVGRAVESVASTIEREVFKSGGAKEPAKSSEASAEPAPVASPDAHDAHDAHDAKDPHDAKDAKPADDDHVRIDES